MKVDAPARAALVASVVLVKAVALPAVVKAASAVHPSKAVTLRKVMLRKATPRNPKATSPRKALNSSHPQRFHAGRSKDRPVLR